MANTKSTTPGFAYYDIGASKKRSYEDRHFFETIQTKSGLDLIVAIVADGVGGGNLGQRAAELTVQTVVSSIQASEKTAKEIPTILGAAIGAANKAVYAEAKSSRDKDGMSSTIAMAVVHNSKLYLANVGDSRVYLVQGDEIKQLTVDHTFANEKIRQGVLSPEKAHAHPNADALTRSVGFEQDILVDLGIYLRPDDDGKTAFQNQGLSLTKEGVILVCSDGLVKSIAGVENANYVEDAEIVKVLKQFHAEEATKILVDKAVGRDVDDNVTVVILEFPGRKISRLRRQRAFAFGALSLVLFFALMFMFFRLRETTVVLNQLSQFNADATATALAATSTALSFTPTPSPTVRPTLVPGEIGVIFSSGMRTPFFEKTPIFVHEFSTVNVNHTGEYEDGMIYLFERSKILFESSPSESMNFVVFPSSQIFVYPGRYLGGANVRISEAAGILDFSVTGSCMALNYVTGKVIVSCYEGTCSYQINYGTKVLIPTGTLLEFDVDTLNQNNNSIPIPQSDITRWLSFLPKQSYGYQCVLKYYSPPPSGVNTPTGPGNEPSTSEATATIVPEPPTAEPPTAAPPTAEPPTAEPPTPAPPTAEPPTPAPPTPAPPTPEPPQPTDEPPQPTDEPPNNDAP